ncbi:MAG: hypothetical protein R8L53_06825 [Mariprofundales bacterium]
MKAWKRNIGAVLLAVFIVSTAQATEISGDMGVFSQYMWRGMQASPSASLQGDLGVDAGNGLSANVWFSSPLGNNAVGGNVTEFDFTTDYSGEFAGISYSLGAIAYTYMNNAAGNAAEVYLGLGYGSASVTYYYAVSGSWQKDAYFDLALSGSIADFDIGATAGFYIPSTDVSYPTAFPTSKSEFGHIDLSLSKSLELNGVIMTPSLLFSIPSYTNKPKNANQFVAGLNFAY